MSDSHASDSVRRILEYFQSLGTMGREMNCSAQIGKTLASTVTAMVEIFSLRHAVLLAAQGENGQLAPVALHNIEDCPQQPIRLTRALQDALLRSSRMLEVASLGPARADLLRANLGDWLGEAHSAIVPLVCGGELVGLFAFDRACDMPPLEQRDCDLLCCMCQNVAVYVYNQIVLSRLTRKHRELEDLYGRIKEIYRQAVMAFLTAIDIKDGYTKEHSLRVAKMAAALARELGFSEHEIEGIYFAGLLHDIGKILVDKQILTKRGSLDLTEYAEMSQHTRLGAEIVSNIRFPWDNLVYAIRHHHDRLAYEEFSPRHRRRLEMGTKIIGLTDAFDAMTSDRPYRRALTIKECLSELVEGLNRQFDPEVTRIFLKVLERDLERPPHRRRILTERLMPDDPDELRHLLAEAIQQVEQFMGVITAY